MPRVLEFFEPPDGGVAEHVYDLVTGPERNGWVATVAGPATSTIRRRLEDQGVEYLVVPALRRGFGRPDRDLLALRWLVRQLRSDRFDLIHVHSSKAGMLGRVAAFLARTPSVYNPHCFGFVGEVSTRRRVFVVAAEWVLGRSTTAIICECDAERRHAKRFHIVPRSKLPLIYNGVRAPDPQLSPDPDLVRFRGDGVLVGSVAVMREQKRLDLLVDVAPELLERFPQARIAIIGNGPLEADLKERARALGLDANDRFAILPFAPPAGQYLLSLDVFVLPSSWESMPMGVLEALSYGVPQVVTDVEGTGEAIAPETGILVPPNDARALADAIAAFLADPERRRAASLASVTRQSDEFAIARMTRETTALYDAILTRRRAGRIAGTVVNEPG